MATSAFPIFGMWHWIILGFTALGAGVLVWYGRSRKGQQSPERVATIMGWLLLADFVIFTVFWALPQRWDTEQSIPLHLSDVLRLIASIALITRQRWAIAVTVFWGLTLNVMSMLTPDIPYGEDVAAHLFSYWSLHILVMWAPIYLVWGLGWRPTWRGYGISFITVAVWAVIALATNLLTGANYGYLNRKPDGASALDLLGGWPTYLLWEVVLVAVVWGAMTGAFMAVRNRTASKLGIAPSGAKAPAVRETGWPESRAESSMKTRRPSKDTESR
ncbi:MAG: YwaF family protein [Gulosibacter sp.]|uniref:YwaF family protein n=1 Tax=Gulosibacter sp. TaxID=2817531 RepID=UPI003F900E8A